MVSKGFIRCSARLVLSNYHRQISSAAAKCSHVYKADRILNPFRYNCSGSRSVHTNSMDEALEACRVWTQRGFGSQRSVNEYSQSGSKYEEYMDALNYCGPQKMAKAAAFVLGDKFDARILDVCAGSGLSGLALAKLGYTNFDAVDGAEGLLAIARSRQIYTTITCHLMGNIKLPVDDDSYDMVVMSGGIGENHFPISAFTDLIRVVRSGGHVINVFREGAGYVPWYEDGLEPFLEGLANQGLWDLVSRETFPDFLEGMDGLTLIHKVR